MRSRSKAREVALHLLYQVEISKRESPQVFKDYFDHNPQKQDVMDFSLCLAQGVLDNYAHIDSLIKEYVKNWEIDRMAIIDRNILRIGCFELLFLEEIPPKVAINEAIELAKRFGDIDSPRFVNGILDKVYKVASKDKDGK